MKRTELRRASQKRQEAALRAGSTFTQPSPGPQRRAGLKPRSAKTAALYRNERVPLVAALFEDLTVCEVPWCTSIATDPHEPLTRARGGSITDPANVRKVCHFHNWQFSNDEQPWMYELGFLVHSWPGDAA